MTDLPFSTVRGALAHHVAEIDAVESGAELPVRFKDAVDGAFRNGFLVGFSDACRLILSMTDDPSTIAIITVFSCELIDITADVKGAKR